MPASMLAHRTDIQGLRAVAVLLVVLYHAELPLPGGFVGVDVFFVISGFVITRLLWREVAITGRVALLRFYGRRARRLLPALGVVLAFVAVASFALQSPFGQQRSTGLVGIAASAFSANAMLFFATGGYFDSPTGSNPLLHMWTLAVEEQFYLFFPLVFAVTRTAGRGASRARVLLALLVILGLSLGACVFVTSSPGLPFGDLPTNRRFAFFGSPTRAWEFAVGGVLAVVEPQLVRLGRWTGTAVWAGGIAAVGFAVFAFDESTTFPGAAALLPVAGAAALVVGGAVVPAPLARLAAARPLVWIGDRSYGWYLWHWPFIIFAQAIDPGSAATVVLAAALSLVPTALSFRYVENPIRHDASYRGLKVVKLAAVCTVVPAVLFAALLGVTRWPPGPIGDLLAQTAPHHDETGGCTGNHPDDARTARSCTWRVAGSSGTVVLLGDSNAGHFVEPVIRAASAAHLDVTLATFGSCPFVDLDLQVDHAFDVDGCRSFVAAWSAEVERTRPAAVIIAMSSADYLADDSGVVLVERGERAATRPAKLEAWQAGLTRVLRPWSARGVPTVIVHMVPHFRGFNLRSCPTFRVLTDVSACGEEMPRAAAEADLEDARQAEARAAAAVSHVTTVDLIDAVCAPSVCATHRGSSWLYRDGAHLTVPFALTLTDRFAAALAEATRMGAPRG